MSDYGSQSPSVAMLEEPPSQNAPRSARTATWVLVGIVAIAAGWFFVARPSKPATVAVAQQLSPTTAVNGEPTQPATASNRTSEIVRTETKRRPTTSSLPQLIPPVTLKTGPIVGSGAERKAEILVTNTGRRSIVRMVVQIYFLTEDGGLDNDVPHTHGGFSGAGGALWPGESERIEVTSFFMKESTARINGVVTQIDFDDDQSWPTWPEELSARSGDSPVSARLIGTIGPMDLAMPVIAFFNHDSRAVRGVDYRFEYLDAAGGVLETGRWGYSGSEPIMGSRQGCAVSGGKSPPTGTESARVTLTNIKFAD